MPTLGITKLRVRTLDIGRREVSWEAGGYADPQDFTLQVWRSESGSGPFDPASPEFVDRYLFVDTNIPVGDKFRQLWYRVRATHKATGAIEDSEISTLEPAPGLEALYIRRSQQVGLTQVLGRQVWLFKRRTFGMRCPGCFDRDLQKVTRSGCISCYGTGFLRGFHNPIEVWMQIDPASKPSDMTPNQKMQAVVTTARMSFYPTLAPGDVVVEFENKRWRVLPGVTQTERLRAVVHQECSMRQLEETDIEYKLPVNVDEALRDIQPSPGRMFTLPTDVNSAIEERTPNVFANYATYPRNLEE